MFHRLLLGVVAILGCVGAALAQEYRGGQYRSTGRLFGVTYSPYALRLDTMCLEVAQVEADMRQIHSVTDHVRLYSLSVCPDTTEAVLRYARNNGMRVILGLYMCGDAKSNDAEVEALKPLVRKYGDSVDAVLVGNEVLFSEIVGLNDLLYYIRRVRDVLKRASVKIPVSTGEVWPVYESSIGAELVAATDFLCMNMQPFWEGWDVFCPPNPGYTCLSAGHYVHAKAEGLESYFRKPVWICESGWPTEGERCCQGRSLARGGLLAGPSEANATIFIHDLVEDGRKAQRPTYIHAMFDEDWKRIWAPCGICEGLSTLLEDPSCSTCELDYHFGIYTAQRSPKWDVQLPNPVYYVS